MGAKIEFCFLIDDSTYTILTTSLNLLFKLGWSYNKHVLGEYTYWKDAPIWKFGESITCKEKIVNSNTHCMENIIRILSENYSPSILLGTEWFNNKISAEVSITENEKTWKELWFSIDRDVTDTIETANKNRLLVMLCDIFIDLATCNNPYYGIGATEIMGFDDLHDIKISKVSLGDLNYLSNNIIKAIRLEEYRDEYEIKLNKSEGVFLIRKHGLFEIG